MLDDLKGLRASLNVAIDLLERLQLVVSAWKGDSLQEALACPPGDDAVPAGNPPV